MGSISFVFIGTTNYCRELLIFLLEKNIISKAIFSIPQEFSISYRKKKVKNTNYVNLKTIADKHKIPYYEIDSYDGKKTKDYEPIIKELSLDLILVLGWYCLVPKSTRELTRYGAWGIHATLLPKYAGEVPLNGDIINGEKEILVTLFRMENGVDDGDIIAQKSFSIEYEDTIRGDYEKATISSKQILAEVLSNIANIKFTPQDKNKIELFPQRKPEDGLIDWNKIYDFVRAQTIAYPCAFSIINGVTLKTLDCKVLAQNNSYKNGEEVNINNKTLVATKDNFLELGVINVGKKQYRFEDYARDKNLWGGYSRAKSLRLVA